jgi:hemolysin activation/secretion protein
VRAEAEVQTPLRGGYLLKTNLRAQHSGSGLASFEEFNFGSLNGGPGYDPGSVAGDSGIAVGLSLEGPSYPVWGEVTVRPLLQLSGARAWNEDQSVSADPRALAAGAGTRFELGDKVNLDIVWAEPLRSSNISSEASRGRVYVQLSTGVSWLKGRLFGGSDPK